MTYDEAVSLQTAIQHEAPWYRPELGRLLDGDWVVYIVTPNSRTRFTEVRGWANYKAHNQVAVMSP